MQQFQLNDEGDCVSCKKLVIDTEMLKCRICRKSFHASCVNQASEEKMCTTSMLRLFNASSTRNNFLFLCDACLTSFEVSLTHNHNATADNVEKSIASIKTEISEVKKILLRADIESKPGAKSSDNIWYNAERLAQVKSNSGESCLVFEGTGKDNENVKKLKLVEDLVVNNEILVTKSFSDKNGNFVVCCESEADRMKLKNRAEASSMAVKVPKERSTTISIVGLTREYTSME
eukprot:gene4379-4964_t